ncbi:ArsJ-associated glyceraldehyde-3-phosphate dehydrogenase [Kordiimonas marina]|uniref:ArsJ-associated glyceraldehyde-3-phosphate dehydrogenase n=1 Tax=Kordiimonas marina TaxID=2872312 RepID=UPI001FF524B3|nr:ArsJ-associated glyceraldehyde-3-phosphate dehydrogenase [Kordiimonas marina]MCJ9429184.1 ArsJ-associated glyceraldehyde-3-phosphate dehydrogenase [Kordiimonas marina]
MALRIAINGFGRMGRLFTRAVWERDDVELVAINDPAADTATLAHLLEFDSVHGRWDKEIASSENGITIDGKLVAVTRAKSPAETGWTGEQVDLVVDCSGRFKARSLLQPFYDQGIRKVLVSAPVKEEGALNLVMGVNHDLYDPAEHDLITAASCTTNCLAPVVKVIHEKIGIRHGSITTVHDVTNTQVIVDAPHKDLRRARSCLQSLIPTTTGSATAITVIYPELKGRLNGHAIRVPLLNASLTDCVFELEQETTAKAVNALFEEAAGSYLEGILGYETRPLVSADYLNDPRSSIIDAPSTMVVNGTQLKLYAWYDNEWGYVHRMADIASMIAASF